MEDKILLCTIFGLELARIWLAIPLLFGGKLRRIWLGAIGYALFLFILLKGNLSAVNAELLLWGMIFLLYFLMIRKPQFESWTWGIREGFWLYYQGELVSILIENITFNGAPVELSLKNECLGSGVSLLMIIIMCIVYQKYKMNIYVMDKITLYLRKMMTPMLVFVLAEMILQTAIFNDYIQDETNKEMQDMVMVINILSMISIGFFAFIVFGFRYMNEKMRHMLHTEREMREQQVQYYEMLLQKEEDTRKYRHDMNAHMMSLRTLVMEGNSERTQLYIDNMMEHMQTIRKSTYTTGNRMLDSILNYYIGQLEPAIEVSVKGECSNSVKISDMDVCTIFSNLFKNAVEALKASEQTKRFFRVQIEEGKRYMEVCIENSADSDHLQTDKNGRLLTSKKDKGNHGFGILNVEDAVQRNGGTLDIRVKENKFCCCVRLRK